MVGSNRPPCSGLHASRKRRPFAYRTVASYCPGLSAPLRIRANQDGHEWLPSGPALLGLHVPSYTDSPTQFIPKGVEHVASLGTTKIWIFPTRTVLDCRNVLNVGIKNMRTCLPFSNSPVHDA